MTFGAWDVTVTFGDDRALHGVTLAVPAGQITVVVGGDGAPARAILIEK